ncbi:hypothetical protein Gogos_020077, partial [Gossypium gossypioides]|nr:hypothetical protein [Gossypium gossypioides]
MPFTPLFLWIETSTLTSTGDHFIIPVP